jgi:2-polyprenyl-3-methyl-5-hydroxy-6-metoxy-1,4-benzoquinol methylase
MMSAVREQLGAGTLEARARQSRGTSEAAIYESVALALGRRDARGEVLVDAGCGEGNLWPFVRERFARCVGLDAVRYESLRDEIEFMPADLNASRFPAPDAFADAVVSVETIEHLENPRAFVRELVRMVKPGGWVVVTTPNQLSFLSMLTLVVKGKFSAFQDVHYPAHLTALLETDLRRIAAECGLADVEIEYTHRGRIVVTPWHYPRPLARLAPRLCSDNLLLVGRKPL